MVTDYTLVCEARRMAQQLRGLILVGDSYDGSQPSILSVPGESDALYSDFLRQDTHAGRALIYTQI